MDKALEMGLDATVNHLKEAQMQLSNPIYRKEFMRGIRQRTNDNFTELVECIIKCLLDQQMEVYKMKMHCDWCRECPACKEVDEFTQRINSESFKVKGNKVVYAFPSYHVADQEMYIEFQLEGKPAGARQKYYGKYQLPFVSVCAMHQETLAPVIENYIKVSA